MSEHILWETIDEQKEKEYKAKLTQAHTEGYNRGYAKAKEVYEQKLEIERNSRIALVKRIAELEAQVEKMKEKLKADLIANLKEQMQYSTSPSCTKGMELFIRSIEEWEIK